MITVLLGQDIYAKAEYLDAFLGKIGQEAQKYPEGESPQLSTLGGNDLFGTSKAYVFINGLKAYELTDLEQAAQSSAQYIFLEDSLDKRLTKSKKILEIATYQEFPAPDLQSAPRWILEHAKKMNITIQLPAATEIANRMMGDTQATLPVVAVHNELLKLASYTGGNEITSDVVTELTPQDLNIDLFKLLDHIGNHKKTEAMHLLQRYYDFSSEDEKVLTIRLVALLSDQIRNLLLTKQLLAQRMPDQSILKQTGWKSGRLYIMKKIASGFKEPQLEAALSKFYSLEKELKSSTLPPRVIVDMIIAVL